MNSTDMTVAGVSTVTSPAVGLRCSVPADRVVLTARYAAPWRGTGLPVVGSAMNLRRRGLTAAGTTGFLATGAGAGIAAQPSVQTTAPKGFAVAGVPARHTSSTPGDLPPEDPLS